LLKEQTCRSNITLKANYSTQYDNGMRISSLHYHIDKRYRFCWYTFKRMCWCIQM